MKFLIMALATMLLAGCGAADPGVQIPAQRWEDVVVKVESRPEPVQPGMNEFLVMTTLERGRPVSDLIVSMRTDTAKPWSQGIQDGLSGVYRKAVNVPASGQYLYVQLRKKRSDEETVLRFPLKSGDRP